MVEPKYHKNWLVPGPAPLGDVAHEQEQIQSVQAQLEQQLAASVTCDALSGRFKIFQLKEGHRFSTDDLLVAWYAAQAMGHVTKILDLGSGIGTVAQILAWKFPAAQMVSVEAQEVSHQLARASIALNGLSERIDARLGDLRDSTHLKSDELFDLVSSSPPYFPETAGIVAEHPQKAACRFELRGDISDYARTAFAHLAPGGGFAWVFPTEGRARVFAAIEAVGGFVHRARPVVLKEGEEPLLFVGIAYKKSDYPERVWGGLGPDQAFCEEPALVIRNRDGSVSREYSVVKASIGFPP
jgi:tRNA1Val (adenine37-N6)-methyltransferase